MTKRVAKPPPPSLPAPLDDHVFETIAHWFDLSIPQIRAEDSHRILPAFIRKLVREGKMTLRRVIELTSNRDAAIDADTALRDMAEEMVERGEDLPKMLTFYLISFPKPSRSKGRCSGDTWLRDHVIANFVGFALDRWGAVIPLTRNSETSAPSICSLVSRAAQSRGIMVAEKRVFQIYQRFAVNLGSGHRPQLLAGRRRQVIGAEVFRTIEQVRNHRHRNPDAPDTRRGGWDGDQANHARSHGRDRDTDLARTQGLPAPSAGCPCV